jgi:hypothetical protein
MHARFNRTVTTCFIYASDDPQPMVLDAGSGTGQLTNFLGMDWRRPVIGADVCMNSLSLLTTFRRKIGVFGIAVKGADKAKPAQGGGRGVKISDGLLHAAREQSFPLRGQC